MLTMIVQCSLLAACLQVYTADSTTYGSDEAICEDVSLPLTFVSHSESSLPPPCSPTSCDWGLDGSVAFSFCLECPQEPTDARPWASCTIADGHDLDRLDLDAGGSGSLRVDLVVTAADEIANHLHGDVLLWYGRYPLRKRLRLFDDGDDSNDPVVPVGPHVLHIAAEDACYVDVSGVPEECQNQCGELGDPSCRQDFSSTELTLTAEACVPGRLHAGTVEVRRISYFPSSCQCIDDNHCEADVQSCMFAALPDARCPARADDSEPIRCGGLCVDHDT